MEMEKDGQTRDEPLIFLRANDWTTGLDVTVTRLTHRQTQIE